MKKWVIWLIVVLIVLGIAIAAFLIIDNSKVKKQTTPENDFSDLPADQQCMAQCMVDAGLTPGVDNSGAEFDACSGKCFESQGRQ